MKIAVALLTCDRYDYTERVVSALAHHNELSGVPRFYADDHSRDNRIHEVVRDYGYEPVFLNTGRRMGCSPTTEALCLAVRDRVGEDAVVIYLQNDFECVRTLPWDLIEDALSRDEIASVKLWDRKVGPNRTGPRTRLLRKATWHADATYSEPVMVSRTGWGYNPQATRAGILCRLTRNVRKELGFMKQAVRLGQLVVRPDNLSFQHIGNHKTPRGIYKSRRAFGVGV